MIKSKTPLNYLWKFDLKDKTTWEYITCNFKYTHNKEIKGVDWIENPIFAFKHLDIS